MLACFERVPDRAPGFISLPAFTSAFFEDTFSRLNCHLAGGWRCPVVYFSPDQGG